MCESLQGKLRQSGSEIQRIMQRKARCIDNAAWVCHKSMAHRFPEVEPLGINTGISTNWSTPTDHINKLLRINDDKHSSTFSRDWRVFLILARVSKRDGSPHITTSRYTNSFIPLMLRTHQFFVSSLHSFWRWRQQVDWERTVSTDPVTWIMD